MATQQEYVELPVDTDRQRRPWVVWTLSVFALVVVATLVYGLVRVVSAPIPKLDLPDRDAPSEWPPPASRPR
jgi:hypothetical protein